MHSCVHQIHLLYCPRLKMPCRLLGFWLTSLVQKSHLIILGILWIDRLAGGEISSKSCNVSLSLDQWSPLSPPTPLSTLQFPVANFSAESENPTNCPGISAAPLSTWQASPCQGGNYKGGSRAVCSALHWAAEGQMALFWPDSTGRVKSLLWVLWLLSKRFQLTPKVPL